ncbi:hypothetical protein GRAN_4733 [Granulicella sibirica]|uniref:Uncharacterized protein n=1 Tax=Granulicella sibirica TaxID=2479048 RepID=A0A4Q0SUN2_9BACT|nr:hypothetical protein GRAN_4733 [Granulicella sibirica]
MFAFSGRNLAADLFKTIGRDLLSTGRTVLCVNVHVRRWNKTEPGF